MKSNDELHKKTKNIFNQLEQNYGEDLNKSSKLLDKLYNVLQEALSCADTAISLSATETIKYAYGLCRMQNKMRFDECNYWRKVALMAMANKQFQVLEYLLEAARILLQASDEQKTTIIETFKILADASAKEGKFFIVASIVKTLTSFLKKLDKQPEVVVGSIISSLNSIGCLAINHNQNALFQEICMLIIKNLSKVNEKQEFYLDKILAKWLGQILKYNAIESLVVWLQIFSFYNKIHQISNTAFYAELIQIVAMYCGRVDQDVLQKINRYFVKHSFANKNPMQNILTIKALASSYNKTLNNFGWQTANYIYDVLYFKALCLVDKVYIRNKVDVCDYAMIEIYLQAIKKAACFSAITMNDTNMQDVLNIWQQVFLFKYKSIKRKKRVEKLFELLEAN